jgi:hypothetical protein
MLGSLLYHEDGGNIFLRNHTIQKNLLLIVTAVRTSNGKFFTLVLLFDECGTHSVLQPLCAGVTLGVRTDHVA